jgi:hypothetical protein
VTLLALLPTYEPVPETTSALDPGQQYDDQPVRLTLTCVREGEERWTSRWKSRSTRGAPPSA